MAPKVLNSSMFATITLPSFLYRKWQTSQGRKH